MEQKSSYLGAKELFYPYFDPKQPIQTSAYLLEKFLKILHEDVISKLK